MTEETSKSPLMTPPATDRGLSDEDFALMKRVLGSGRQWPLNPRELSALLAAARREGESRRPSDTLNTPFRKGEVVDLGSGVTWRLTEKTARMLNRKDRP